MSIDNAYGKMIKNARLKKKWKQSDLANELNVTTQAVSNWENGKNGVDRDIMEKLHDLLGISPYMMFNFERSSDMKLASLENVKDLDSLDREIDVIVNSIEIESYAKPIRLLLKKTIQLAVGYIVYYIPRVEKEYEITWDNVGYTLRDFLDTEELRTGWCSNDISLVFKRQISRYSYLIGGELFEDFEDWDKPEDLAKRYDKDFGGLAQYAENDLQGLLPDIDNEIMTLYKIALYEVSQNLIGYDE